VLALRLAIQGLSSPGDLPVQVLLPIGGNATLRGSPQDRFLDKVAAIGNAELRFPIFWRFGAIGGLDAGKVWSSFGKLDVQRWAVNPTVGLRFYMDTFLVRLDIGFGSETTGFYLNFGHIF
jgi:hemolysin activation/secretion protein